MVESCLGGAADQIENQGTASLDSQKLRDLAELVGWYCYGQALDRAGRFRNRDQRNDCPLLPRLPRVEES